MRPQSRKSSLVWGSLLVLFGVMAMIEQFIDLSLWIWAGVLVASGLGTFVIYLTERTAWGLLLTAYILWAITLLIAFTIRASSRVISVNASPLRSARPVRPIR